MPSITAEVVSVPTLYCDDDNDFPGKDTRASIIFYKQNENANIVKSLTSNSSMAHTKKNFDISTSKESILFSTCVM